MKLGIGSYALAWSIGVAGYEAPAEPLSWQGLLELAAKRNVPLVQICDHFSLHAWSDNELNALREFAGALNVSLEIGTRGTDPALLLRYLEIAERLGSPLVRTLISNPDPVPAIRELDHVLPRYERSDVLLAVENHGLHTTRQLVSLFDALSHPHLGCCLDTVNSFGALEAPETVIRALAPYTVNLHLKDFEIRRVDHQMGFAISGTPAGSGRLNIEIVLRELRHYGKCKSAILELWTPFTGSVESTVELERSWLEKSLDYLGQADDAFSSLQRT